MPTASTTTAPLSATATSATTPRRRPLVTAVWRCPILAPLAGPTATRLSTLELEPRSLTETPTTEQTSEPLGIHSARTTIGDGAPGDGADETFSCSGGHMIGPGNLPHRHWSD